LLVFPVFKGKTPTQTKPNQTGSFQLGPGPTFLP